MTESFIFSPCVITHMTSLLSEKLTTKLTPDQRIEIEEIAEDQDISLGEAARILIQAGMDARRKG